MGLREDGGGASIGTGPAWGALPSAAVPDRRLAREPGSEAIPAPWPGPLLGAAEYTEARRAVNGTEFRWRERRGRSTDAHPQPGARRASSSSIRAHQPSWPARAQEPRKKRRLSCPASEDRTQRAAPAPRARRMEHENMFVRESVMVGGRALTLETGRLAKQAHGSVLVTFGDTMVLVTAVSQDERPGLDFFPLTCEFVEKTYAAGKIPGGFFKREARQRDDEILACRIMDRPLRPLFPEGFRKDTQVIATVLSSDKQNKADVLALTGASAALHISDIPWSGPIVGVRVGRKDGELVAYPTVEDLEGCDLDLIVACSRDAIVMVEGGAAEATENDVIDALMFGHQTAQPVLDLIEKLRAAVGKPKREFKAAELAPEVKATIARLVDEDLKKATK